MILFRHVIFAALRCYAITIISAMVLFSLRCHFAAAIVEMLLRRCWYAACGC